MAKSAAVKSSKVEKTVTKVDKKATKAAKKAESSSESDSDSSSASDSESEDEEEEEKKEEKAESSDSSDSDSDSDSDEEETKENSESATSSDSESNKRKTEEKETTVAAKKTKTEDASPASATVFVGGLSWNVDNDWLRTEFTECGEILDVRVITDRDSQRSKGFAYVEFATQEGANAALALAGKEIDGRAIRVDLSESRQKKDAGAKSSSPQGDATDTLFIGNLSFNATEDDIRGAFAECGEIISIRLPTDRETGQPKGFGYIQFSSIEEAKAAVAWNGSELAGRPCRLDYAGKKPERSEGGGFGGGRGGRGGRGGFGGGRGGRGGRGGSSTNRGGFGSFSGNKVTF
ncbi:hypothetical protein BGZ46_001464 [Entomortierella lignicola]|nr:hypothetical protein BGZ46_001464 [Entomortierella lignicola]